MSADVFKVKRGSTAAVAAYLPALGELVLDTTLMQLRVGDGVTLGGVFTNNAPTATKLLNARTIATTGAVTGSVSFDGSTNVSMATTIAPNTSLPGVPTVATAAVDTSSLQISSTAFVLGQASSVAPTIDGIATIGTSLRYARADHVHPTDTSRAPTASPTFTGLVTVNGGQLKFPAVQLPSVDPNTLDDYEEGVWTPAVTFATPGNLAITYSNQLGFYTKVGREVTVRFNIVTSAFTFTTASGLLQITGLPFANSATAGSGSRGNLDFGGITKASYTHFTCQTGISSSIMTIGCSGSGQATSTLAATDTPTGGTLTLIGTITYMT